MQIGGPVGPQLGSAAGTRLGPARPGVWPWDGRISVNLGRWLLSYGNRLPDFGPVRWGQVVVGEPGELVVLLRQWAPRFRVGWVGWVGQVGRVGSVRSWVGRVGRVGWVGDGVVDGGEFGDGLG